MAWSIIINNLQDYKGFPPNIIETFVAGNIAYPFDAQLALIAAKEAGLASATLAGARTPNPYGGDDVVDIAIHGFAEHKDLAEFMKVVVVQPEEAEAHQWIAEQPPDDASDYPWPWSVCTHCGERRML